jgi:toxin ParE1/3/4
LPEWLRELVARPNHMIFYRVLEESGAVEILRIKHAAQQMP